MYLLISHYASNDSHILSKVNVGVEDCDIKGSHKIPDYHTRLPSNQEISEIIFDSTLTYVRFLPSFSICVSAALIQDSKSKLCLSGVRRLVVAGNLI